MSRGRLAFTSDEHNSAAMSKGAFACGTKRTISCFNKVFDFPVAASLSHWQNQTHLDLRSWNTSEDHLVHSQFDRGVFWLSISSKQLQKGDFHFDFCLDYKISPPALKKHPKGAWLWMSLALVWKFLTVQECEGQKESLATLDVPHKYKQ